MGIHCKEGGLTFVQIERKIPALERNNFCDFDKQRKHAHQKGKIESNKQSK